MTNAPHGCPIYFVAARQFRRQLFCGLLSVATAIGQTKPRALDPREIYKKVEAAVVAIELYGPDGKIAKTGSGFLVSSDGKLLTNYHVIAHSSRLRKKPLWLTP